MGLAVSQFSQALRDLVNLGERGLASLQVLVAGMDVGLLGERRVVVTRLLADDRDRHARVLLVATRRYAAGHESGNDRSEQLGCGRT